MGRGIVGRIAGLAAAVWMACELVGFGAAAQAATPRGPGVGVVVRVAEGEVFCDLNQDRGAVAGARVRLYRRITVKHPITRKKLTDYFLLGVVTLDDAGEHLSYARTDGGVVLSHAPTVGDLAQLVPERSAAAVPTLTTATVDRLAAAEGDPPDARAPAAACPRCEMDTDAEAVHDVWLAAVGRPLDARIALWGDFLVANPDSPFVDHVREHVAWLEKAQQWTQRIPREAAQTRVLHEPLEAVEVGMAWTPAVTITRPARVQRVLLHLRAADEPDYETLQMARSGDHAWQVDVPGELVTADGFAYFIEVVERSGAVVARWRSAEEPARVDVIDPVVAEEDQRGRSRLQTRVDYVDFYMKDPLQDAYWQLEVDYAYRLGTWLWAVRAGAGIISGWGGPKDRITLATDHPDYEKPVPLTTTYAFLELEFRLHEIVYLLGRVSAGSLRDAADPDDIGETLVGTSAGIRIGHPDRTNLLLSYTFNQVLGMEGEVNLTLDLLEDWPLGAEVIVTNFPVGEDVGVRLVARAGWRGLDWLEIGLRVGYDIRDINHYGASVGIDLAFDW